jgi:hypothetical protein
MSSRTTTNISRLSLKQAVMLRIVVRHWKIEQKILTSKRIRRSFKKQIAYKNVMIYNLTGKKIKPGRNI